MYRLEKEFVFESAHFLPDHAGKCKRMHGHSWKGTAIVSGPMLQQNGTSKGMLLDYGDMKKAIEEMVENHLDHFCLNESLASFNVTNPTSENIACWIYWYLKKKLPNLVEVIIQETCTCRCVYHPNTPNDTRRDYFDTIGEIK